LRSALANTYKSYRYFFYLIFKNNLLNSHSTTASQPQNISSKDDNEPEFGRCASELDPEDQDCLQRFMKIKVFFLSIFSHF